MRRISTHLFSIFQKGSFLAQLNFLKTFKKQLTKLENVSTGFAPPTYWYTTGNYALNKVLTGSYFKGIPQGRISSFVGPSAAGKSFISCSIIREAQKTGAHVLVLDSENALDPVFMTKIGIDVNDENLTYVQVVTIQDVTAVLSEFLTGYEKELGKFNKDGQRVLILLDSLGNLLTDAENEKFDKGIQTGDQGQSAKTKKHVLRTLVSRLDRCNATFIMTDQVYPQDVMAGDGAWAITNGVKYSASQIAILTKLKLKEDSEIIGIRMRIESYKSRFSKPGTKIELEVPYTTGLSSVSGLIESLVDDNVLIKDGHGFKCDINGEIVKFYKKDFDEAFAIKLLNGNPIVQKNETLLNSLQTSFKDGLELDDLPAGLTTETFTT